MNKTPFLLSDYFQWGARTYLQGIVNVTPDSFSGDGLGTNLPALLEQARRFEPEIDIYDVGGESTRPRATPVEAATELERVLPAIRAIRSFSDKPISIDTMKPQVAQAALEAGANIVNDVTGLRDPAMRELVARRGVATIVMHMRGTPQNMMEQTDYGGDVVGALLEWFSDKLRELENAGIARAQIIIDPGIGFAKTAAQNIEILQRLPEFRTLGLPVLIGLSRKRFIADLVATPGTTELPPGYERDYGTAAAIGLAIAGGADIVRVHNVGAIAGAVRVADAIARKKHKK
jgi:dihydropteroate synthase